MTFVSSLKANLTLRHLFPAAMSRLRPEGEPVGRSRPSLDSGGDPQDVGSVDEGMDAESRPPVHPWTLGLGLDMARRKDIIIKRKAFKESFSEISIFIFPCS